MPDAAVARAVLAADLALLADLDAQIDAATAELARLVPMSPFRTLLTRHRVGARCAPATTAAPWATLPASPPRGRSTAPPG